VLLDNFTGGFLMNSPEQRLAEIGKSVPTEENPYHCHDHIETGEEEKI
jgi:hypothetical protein